jgi:hypothetical protein
MSSADIIQMINETTIGIKLPVRPRLRASECSSVIPETARHIASTSAGATDKRDSHPVRSTVDLIPLCCGTSTRGVCGVCRNSVLTNDLTFFFALDEQTAGWLASRFPGIEWSTAPTARSALRGWRAAWTWPMQGIHPNLPHDGRRGFGRRVSLCAIVQSVPGWSQLWGISNIWTGGRTGVTPDSTKLMHIFS